MAEPDWRPRLHKWSATFRDSELEAKFVRARFDGELRRTMRVSLWASMVLYVGLIGLDAVVVPDALAFAWVLRLGITAPLVLVLAILASSRFAFTAWRPIAVIHTLGGAALYITLGLHAESPGGLLYVCFAVLYASFGLRLTRPGMPIAAFTSAALLVGVTLAVVLDAASGWRSDVFLIALYGTGCSYGLWSEYVSEIADRRAFRATQLIKRQHAQLVISKRELEEAQGEIIAAHQETEKKNQELSASLSALEKAQTETLAAHAETLAAHEETLAANRQTEEKNEALSASLTALEDAQRELIEAHGLTEAKNQLLTASLVALEEAQGELLAAHRQTEEKNQALSASLSALEEAQGRLVEAQKMAALGQLVAGVAHELNTPLGVAVTAASFLESEVSEMKDEKDPEELEERMEGAEEASKLVLSNVTRAAALVKRFKQLALEETGDSEPSDYALGELLEDVVRGLQLTIAREGPQIEVVCPKELRMLGHQGPLVQVLQNLVANSVLHAFDGRQPGTVTIEATAEDGELVLKHRDDGIGMSEEVQAKLFDPFFTTKRGRGGLGLGMHLVYSLVHNKLGGTITCESTLGKGTCFTLRSPQGM